MRQIRCPGCGFYFDYEKGKKCPKCNHAIDVQWIKDDLRHARKKVRRKAIIIICAIIIMFASAFFMVTMSDETGIPPIWGAFLGAGLFSYGFIALTCIIGWSKRILDRPKMRDFASSYAGGIDSGSWSDLDFTTAEGLGILSLIPVILPIVLVAGGSILLTLSPLLIYAYIILPFLSQFGSQIVNMAALALFILLTFVLIGIYISHAVKQWKDKENLEECFLIMREAGDDISLFEFAPEKGIDGKIDEILRKRYGDIYENYSI
ncbi:MAG: alkaline shock response membrane anchor protein AmaP [Lachnospiraceae bacterium]|nr:alkaline shock response membrane anchor protein AmaP [Lachnospiraceae bacterium]